MQLSGVGLEGEAKEQFNSNQMKLAELSTAFSNNLLDATKAYSMLITEPAQVSGAAGGGRYPLRYPQPPPPPPPPPPPQPQPQPQPRLSLSLTLTLSLSLTLTLTLSLTLTLTYP